MGDVSRIESSKTIPRIWRILIYTTSILGFNNLMACSWLPAKLRTASAVYHGFILLIHTINATIFLVGLRLDGALHLWTSRLSYFLLIICGAFLSATNFCVTFTKRPNVCFQTWAKCNMQQNKNNTQAFILCIVPLVMAAFATISGYYNLDTMFTNADHLAPYLFPFLVGGEKLQQIMYWVIVVIGPLILLASSLYSALLCNIIIEIYVCNRALHQDLLNICLQQHVSECELQTWRRKFRYQEKFLKSVNGYMGGTMFVLIILSVSVLILAIFKSINETIVNLSLVLPICITVLIFSVFTLPSAILNGKVSTKVGITHVWIMRIIDRSIIGCINRGNFKCT